jgi:sec-independent protein translocase protein TatA
MAALPFGVGPMELFIILIIVLILFGPKRLPQLGKSLGKTVKAIREGAEGEDDDDDEDGEEEAPKPKKSKKKDEDEEDEE